MTVTRSPCLSCADRGLFIVGLFLFHLLRHVTAFIKILPIHMQEDRAILILPALSAFARFNWMAAVFADHHLPTPTLNVRILASSPSTYAWASDEMTVGGQSRRSSALS